MIAFLVRMLNLAFGEGYPLKIREIERVGQVMAETALPLNEQVQPWDVVAIAVNGDVTTYSPDFMELKSAHHNNFCFGNILQDDFGDLNDNTYFRRATDDIRVGVELCRTHCRYFGVCGGGAPSNKMFENKSLKSDETSFCRLSIQAPADALLEFLRNRSAIRLQSSFKWTSSQFELDPRLAT